MLKRLNQPKEIEKLYNSIAVGGEIKLGIKRGPEMHLISYAKIDPANLCPRDSGWLFVQWTKNRI